MYVVKPYAITHNDGFCFFTYKSRHSNQRSAPLTDDRTTTDDDARVRDSDGFAMGIKGLTGLLQDNAPGCVREQKFESYLDRKVAIDASMHIYQFMVRRRDATRGDVTSSWVVVRRGVAKGTDFCIGGAFCVRRW